MGPLRRSLSRFPFFKLFLLKKCNDYPAQAGRCVLLGTTRDHPISKTHFGQEVVCLNLCHIAADSKPFLYKVCCYNCVVSTLHLSHRGGSQSKACVSAEVGGLESFREQGRSVPSFVQSPGAPYHELHFSRVKRLASELVSRANTSPKVYWLSSCLPKYSNSLFRS